MTARPHAFTLIEILVAATIIALAASVSAAFIWMTSSSVRLSSAAQTVVADLQYAQSQAITTQHKTYVLFTIGTPSKADQYELQSPLGTAIRRPAAAAGTVTMGKANAQLPSVKLALASSFTIGFDAGGQPFLSSGATETPLMAARQIPLKDLTGSVTTTVSILPFTGEITVQ